MDPHCVEFDPIFQLIRAYLLCFKRFRLLAQLYRSIARLKVYMLMIGDVQKLMFVGFAIIVTSFMIVTNTYAQATQGEKDFDYRIQSKEDYIKAERMVDALAEELYAIHQSYPDLTVQHHFNTQNELVDITVEGIDDPSVADQAALCFMKLEKLAVAVRDVDPAYVPQRTEIKESDILDEMQSQEFTPERKTNTGVRANQKP